MNTILFKDPLNSCIWFLLDNQLLCAPAYESDNDICPAEAHSPDQAPEYMKDFVTNLLADENQHRIFTDRFFELETAVLSKAVNEGFNGHLTMKAI